MKSLHSFSMELFCKGGSDEKGGQTDNNVKSDLEPTSHHLELP